MCRWLELRKYLACLVIPVNLDNLLACHFAGVAKEYSKTFKGSVVHSRGELEWERAPQTKQIVCLPELVKSFQRSPSLSIDNMLNGFNGNCDATFGPHRPTYASFSTPAEQLVNDSSSEQGLKSSPQ